MAGLDHPECPYFGGNSLTVQVKEASLPSLRPFKTIHLDVSHRFEPVTLSPVVVVTVEETGDTLVAKFFDRRFNPGFRRYKDYKPWDENREEAYRDYLVTGEAETFHAGLYDETAESIDEEAWTAKDEEVYAFAKFRDYYENEMASYRQNVPTMFGTASFQTFEPENAEHRKYFEVHAILMEYIHGFNLESLTDHAPSSTWIGIVEDAIGIVEAAGDFGVLNNDMSPRHFLIRSRTEGKSTTYQPVMFDFGLTQQREDFATLEEWLRAKECQEEEGAIGVMMRRPLEKADVTYRYVDPQRYGCIEEDPASNALPWFPPVGRFTWRTNWKQWHQILKAGDRELMKKILAQERH